MIFVENEFSPLKKVVLAQSEFGFPKEPRPEDLRFLSKEAVKENFENKGKDYSEVFPELQKQWEGERENLKKTLEEYGVEVLRPRKLSSVEKEAVGTAGYSNFFVRDPFFTVGNFIIESSLRFLHRRSEIFPVRDLFLQEIYPEECIYVAVPQPEIADAEDSTLGKGPFLEGGDVLVLGKQVFVGNSGLASNELGVQWLRKLLKPQGYTVEQVKLHPDILHLDCALGLVREELMIICEDAFLDGIPAALKEWKKIHVTLDEAMNLATNGLSVSPKVYITDPSFKHIGNQIEQENIRVEYIDFSISRSFGGSFRCSTQPLLRH
ncbi:arginine deiminase family protein [Chryseobacterium sp. 2987]|uniref:dimethylarginine dimethylaminohydrolase family protein n=1 Tax=Chryseobacterium sp. 2987 TaxID=2817767 RepID=UPI00285B5B8C|nr:arginine deiminase family protein [Chryseobacterium sp. 2987]MDR6923580.1 N-dimethylarginine dimethylaminohydrolase [Chryseobacterium sp. 2987]